MDYGGNKVGHMLGNVLNGQYHTKELTAGDDQQNGCSNFSCVHHAVDHIFQGKGLIIENTNQESIETCDCSCFGGGKKHRREYHR